MNGQQVQDGALRGPLWFALSVKHQHERTVATEAERLGFETLVPLYRALRKWTDRTKELELPLFPAYVFVRFPYEARVKLLRIPSVSRIVGFGGVPAPLAPQEVADLRAVVDSKLPVSPWPYLKAGDHVSVTRGPLKGLCGTLLREKDHLRLVIGVELLQRSVAVELSPEMIVPVGAARALGVGAAGI